MDIINHYQSILSMIKISTTNDDKLMLEWWVQGQYPLPLAFLVNNFLHTDIQYRTTSVPQPTSTFLLDGIK